MDGYIQIELGGKNVGLKFNMYAMEELAKSKIKEIGNYASSVTMVWAGYLGNCFAKQIEPELLFEEVSEWVEMVYLDEEKTEQLTKISEVFSSSQAFKKLTERGQKVQHVEEDSKKKKQISSASTKLSLAKSA